MGRAALALADARAACATTRLEELGGIQWPCPDEEHPGSPLLHERLWAEPARGAAGAVLASSSTSPPFEALDADYPIRLTTGRRLESYNTGAQTNLYRSPLHRGESLDLSPEDAERLLLEDGEIARVSSRRGSVEAPVRIDPSLRPGLAFMTFHFPDQVDTNLLTIDATDPKSGTAEFKAAAIRVEKLEPADAARAPAIAEPAARRAWQHVAGSAPRPRRRARPTPSAPPSTRVLGPPASGWDGGARRRGAVDGHTARGGHEARARRHLLLPALHALQERIGWISPGGLNYLCRAADGAAGRRLRRRDVLRAASPSSRGRRASSTSARTSPAAATAPRS